MLRRFPLPRFLSASATPGASPWSRKAHELTSTPLPSSPHPKLQPAPTKQPLPDQQPTQAAYNAAIRSRSDPALSVKLLEDELAEVVAGALKKQHDKLTILIGEAAGLRGPAEGGVGVEAFEAKRKECMDARWEMIIHRTACGFKAGVYDVVERMYPMPAPLPGAEPGEAGGGAAAEPVAKTDRLREFERRSGTSAKKFGTQTDWWRERLHKG